MLTFIYFILILGLVVTIHEFGHFIFAKRAGIYVYEFSIGMGPRLFKFNRKKKIKDQEGKIIKVDDETNYCIRLFPIGGFVQMAGEEVEVDETVPENMRLQNKKWHQRFIVMVAGVMNNFVLAFIILLFIGLTNTVTTNPIYVGESVVEGLNAGDKIIKVEGRKTGYYEKLALELTIQGEKQKQFEITVKDKNGEIKNITINPIKLGETGLIYGRDIKFDVIEKKVNNKKVLEVTNSRLDTLKNGYKIISINGINVSSYLEFLRSINNQDSLVITYEDLDGKITETIVEVDRVKKDRLRGYAYDFTITGKQEKGFLVGIKYAFTQFVHIIGQMFWTVFYLITGKLSVKMLSGPVGIYKVVGQAASIGFVSVLSLIALLNINVGFINILPLPAFDGGHALFLIIEKIIGRPLNQKIENTIHTIFLGLLMLLMVYVTFNDILRLF